GGTTGYRSTLPHLQLQHHTLLGSSNLASPRPSQQCLVLKCLQCFSIMPAHHFHAKSPSLYTSPHTHLLPIARLHPAMDETVKLHTKQHYCTGRNAEVDGDIFKFKGESYVVGVVKILEPTSPMLNYYEYEIIDRGEKCAIGIGVGEQTYPLDRMPGWNAHGIGYHADDGKLFHYDNDGKPFGPTSDVGDRMGCGVDFET
ncbi:hypothetical protein EMCRGX_G023681, partial [Ephydatia muelleri]